MSLANSLNKFRAEFSDATTRNAQHARPSSNTPVARSSTPKPPGENSKRTHDAAFASSANVSASASASGPPTSGHAGTEIFTQVFNAVKYLREKDGKPVAFESLIGYLSLPNDARKNIPYIKRALAEHMRVEFVPKAQSATGKDSFKYRPFHPVTNPEQLKSYLASQPTARGIIVKDLKDGWQDCVVAIDQLEKEGFCLVTRNKKDNVPKFVWTDSPNYHILNPTTQLPQKLDADFMDVWSKTKLPATETEVRNELEKAGLTPTSQVKEINRADGKRKEKRKINRKGGKTTNNHMLGILKDYSKK